MMDDILDLLRDRLVKTAEDRLGRVRALLAFGKGAAVADELHALAGEASVIGADEMARVARDAERAAKAWSAAPDAGPEGCQSALEALDAALRRLKD